MIGLKILLKCFFQQLTKVGLPGINVVSGVNPLGNGIINPAGKK